jgi:hypothetical protein
MATAKSGSFRLTETVNLPNASVAGSFFQGEIDLGAYVNVGTGQAIAVESVDFIWQVGADFAGNVSAATANDTAWTAQLTSLNPGTALVRADDQSLIASGSIMIDDSNNVATETTDFYPDNFGPANLSESYMVVNDSLYLVAANGASALADVVNCTVVIKCRIVKLGQKDWVAIAIQSTASDN